MYENSESVGELEKQTEKMRRTKEEPVQPYNHATESSCEFVTATTLSLTLVQALGLTSPMSIIANDPGPQMLLQLLLTRFMCLHHWFHPGKEAQID